MRGLVLDCETNSYGFLAARLMVFVNVMYLSTAFLTHSFVALNRMQTLRHLVHIEPRSLGWRQNWYHYKKTTKWTRLKRFIGVNSNHDESGDPEFLGELSG